ncbi:MAG: hypothetical protein M1823_009127, partial [Watsoniomyces obsoletus]
TVPRALFVERELADQLGLEALEGVLARESDHIRVGRLREGLAETERKIWSIDEGRGQRITAGKLGKVPGPKQWQIYCRGLTYLG